MLASIYHDPGMVINRIKHGTQTYCRYRVPLMAAPVCAYADGDRRIKFIIYTYNPVYHKMIFTPAQSIARRVVSGMEYLGK